MHNLAPAYINEHQSDLRGVKDGWYAMNGAGQLSFGPFPNRENCLSRISQFVSWTASSALRQRPV